MIPRLRQSVKNLTSGASTSASDYATHQAPSEPDTAGYTGAGSRAQVSTQTMPLSPVVPTSVGPAAAPPPAQLRTELDFDPTLSFFAKPHTISVLVVMLAAFLYVALYVTDESADWIGNAKMYGQGVRGCPRRGCH